MSQGRIDLLPYDIWDKIFRMLEGENLAMVQRVCRTWRTHMQEPYFKMTRAVGILYAGRAVVSDFGNPQFIVKLLATTRTFGLTLEIERLIQMSDNNAIEPRHLVDLARFKMQIGKSGEARAYLQEALRLSLAFMRHIRDKEDSFMIDRITAGHDFMMAYRRVAQAQVDFGWSQEVLETVKEGVSLVKAELCLFDATAVLSQAGVVADLLDILPVDCEIEELVNLMAARDEIVSIKQLWQTKRAVKLAELDQAKNLASEIELADYRSEGWHAIALQGDLSAIDNVTNKMRSYTWLRILEGGDLSVLKKITNLRWKDYAFLALAQMREEDTMELSKSIQDPGRRGAAIPLGVKELAKRGKSREEIEHALLESGCDSENDAFSIVEEGLKSMIAVGRAYNIAEV